MAVIGSAGANDFLGFLKNLRAHGTAVGTDGRASYAQVPQVGSDRVRIAGGGAHRTSELLPLVHTLLANIEAWSRGAFHGARKTSLAAWLTQFAHPINRRAHDHSGKLWSFVLQRLARGPLLAWQLRNPQTELRRTA